MRYPQKSVISMIRKLLKLHNKVQSPAVDNLNFRALQGQITVMLGVNGSGKSTILAGIAGIGKIESGAIAVNCSGGLGLCPQRNILWEDLTVVEHIQIFTNLKINAEHVHGDEVDRLITACGQKRKLKLAMMLAGGSTLCCIDEVSSGIDPIARRDLWDILQNERRHRPIILTTHFLDEADVLADQLVIINAGSLIAERPSAELKSRYGEAYQIICESELPQFHLGKLSATKVQHDPASGKVLLTFQDISKLRRVLEELATLDIKYSINGPQLEDVFLKLLMDKTDRSLTAIDTTDVMDESLLTLSLGSFISFPQQVATIFWTRYRILKVSYVPHIAALIIPIIAAGITSLLLKNLQPLTCGSAPQSTGVILAPSGLINQQLLYGPMGVELTEVIRPLFNVSSAHAVRSLEEFNEYLQDNYATTRPGGLFIDSQSNNSIFAYLMDEGLRSGFLAQNILNSAIINSTIFADQGTFETANINAAGKTYQFILYFGLAMSLAPAFFVLYPTYERLSRIRDLHYSNGVRRSSLWVSYFLFDMIVGIAASAIVIGLLSATWAGWHGLGYLFIVFILYGLSSLLYSYVISLLVTSSLAAFVIAAGSQAGFFFLEFIAYLLVIAFSPAKTLDDTLTKVFFLTAWIIPSGPIVRNLLLVFNESSLLCRDQSSLVKFGDMKAYGGPILILIVQIVIGIAHIAFRDGWRPRGLYDRIKRKGMINIQDKEAAAIPMQGAIEGLRLVHTSKCFGSTVVVEDLSFDVPKGEIYALLGPNGAGKSTTISMIRGEQLLETGGTILVNGIPVVSNVASQHGLLGVCPQFDAIDRLTVEQHLDFYAHIRGVPGNVRLVLDALGLTKFKSQDATTLSGGNKRKLSLAIALIGNPDVLLLDEPSSGMDAIAKRTMWRNLKSVANTRATLMTTHSMEEANFLAHSVGILSKRLLASGTVAELTNRYSNGVHVHMVHKDAPLTSEETCQTVHEWIRTSFPTACTDQNNYYGQFRFVVPFSFSNTNIQEKGASMTTLHYKCDGGSDSHSLNRLTARIFGVFGAETEKLGISHFAIGPGTLEEVFFNVIKDNHLLEPDEQVEKTALNSRRPPRIWRRILKSARDTSASK